MGGFSGVCPQRLRARVLASNLLMFLLWNKWLCIPSGSVPQTPAVGPLSARGQLSHATLCAQHMWSLALNGEIFPICQNNDFSVFWVSSWCDPMKVPLPPSPCTICCDWSASLSQFQYQSGGNSKTAFLHVDNSRQAGCSWLVT